MVEPPNMQTGEDELDHLQDLRRCHLEGETPVVWAIQQDHGNYLIYLKQYMYIYIYVHLRVRECRQLEIVYAYVYINIYTM